MRPREGVQLGRSTGGAAGWVGAVATIGVWAAALVEVVHGESGGVEHAAAGIEILVGDHTVVRVPRGFDSGELVRVLEAVRRAC